MGELVLNNVLCYISNARASAAANEIINTAHAFYESAQIIKAKDLIVGLINEAVVRRKGDDKFRTELKDILEAFSKAEQNSIALPTFVANGSKALPPSSGFEVLVDIINDLKDEITALKSKVTSIDNNRVLTELGQMRKELRDMNDSKYGGAIRRGFAHEQRDSGANAMNTSNYSSTKMYIP